MASSEGYRLSPQQRYLWRMDEGAPGFPCQFVLRLDGDLDVLRLKRAVRTIVDRHEILRTTFQRLPGMKLPLQVVGAGSGPVWADVDLRAFAPAEQQDRIEQTLRQSRGRCFDYAVGPLLDAGLLVLSSGSHLLLLTLPALCADTWSLRNLAIELGSALAGEGPAEEPLQYLQFSEWQNEILTDEQEATGREFWRQKLATLPSPVGLPFARERVGAASWEPLSRLVAVGSEACGRLEAAAVQAAVPFPVFLLACWQVLLWRRCEMRDPVVGMVYEMRKFEELRGALGLFAKSIPLQVRCDSKLRLRDIARRTDRAVKEAHDWQEYFAWPEEAEASPESQAVTAGFEFIEALSSFRANGLELSMYDQRVYIDRSQIKLVCRRGQRGLELELQYDAGSLPADEVGCLLDQYVTLLDSAVAEPGAAIADLDLLSADERRRLVVEFNATAVPLPGGTVHRLFEEQARRGPRRVAVRFEDRSLTYAELDGRANQLAHHLRDLGVGPEVIVGLYLDRSPEMVIALLAVLKAGGAYLPLDLDLPGQRLAAMLESAGASVILTRAESRGGLPAEGVRAVALDDDAAAIDRQPLSDLPAGAAPENLAYVLFTSGSTGVPKAVGIEHRQLVNYVQAIATRLDLPAEAGYCMVSTFSADLGNTAVFPALCGGGCLHVMEYERTVDPDGFGEYLSRHAVDCLKIVPSHLLNLLTGAHPERVLPRRVLVLGGEASSQELAQRLRDLAPACRILNHYGPTETTIGATTFEVTAGIEEATDDGRRWRLPLGRPLANVRAYLLDEFLRPVAGGIAGELHLGGAGLARGYVGRPERTAERFLPDPLADRPGARMYQTGDLARFLPSGELEFLGRADHQVKIRGFRVELGEIESQLRRHPTVREAVVVLREDHPEKRRLVAYLVAARPQADGTALRQFLRESLPEHMVPAAFVWLGSLPLGPNGKLDRHALPVPEEVRPGALGGPIAPRTLGEEMLVELWGEVLHGEKVGVHDNFFEQGGDSLQAIQLISRIRDVFQVELPVRSLFNDPTIAGLAAMIEGNKRGAPAADPPRLERVPRGGELPLSFGQQRLWFMHQMNPESPAYNSTGPVRLEGKIDRAALARAIDEVVRRHEVLRTTYRAGDSGPVQVIHPPHPVLLAGIDLAELPDRVRELEARRVASLHSQRPFDLIAGPLLRIVLLRLGEEEWVLVGTMHHIVSDGWSTGVLVRELVTLYQSFSLGFPSPLPELPIQYADYAAWQRRGLTGEVLELQLAYWRRQLSGAPELFELKTSRPRPERPDYRGGIFQSILPFALVRGVLALCREEGVTLFMALLAAFDALLGRYSDREDIVVGTDIANRTRVELEGLIGFFVNNLVLRVDLSGNPTFRELLGRVRETTLGAFMHQDLPFEILVRELQPKRHLTYTPLFQVLFVLQNTPGPNVSLSTLKARDVEIEFGLTKFDLAVFVNEREAGLVVYWSYRSDLFDAHDIARLAGHFETLLESIVAGPELPLNRLEIFSRAESEQRESEKSDRKKARLKKLRRHVQ